MKQKTQHITAVFLALLVLFSSVSFTVNKHICGGEIASVAYFVPADDCGMQMAVCENYSSNKKTSFDKEPCCKDVSEIIKGNTIQQQALESITIAQPAAIIVPFITIQTNTANFFTSVRNSVSYYQPPPLIKQHRQDVLQVFRI